MKKISFFLGAAILGIAVFSAVSNAGNEGYFSGGPSESLIAPKLDLGRINTGSFAQKGEKRVVVKRVRRLRRAPKTRFPAVSRAAAVANRAIDGAKRAVAAANRAIKAANRLGARMWELELEKKPRKYMVVEGNSLWRIAKSSFGYGNASLWKRIFDANQDKIKNPDLIYPGQILNIP